MVGFQKNTVWSIVLAGLAAVKVGLVALCDEFDKHRHPGWPEGRSRVINWSEREYYAAYGFCGKTYMGH